jgi:predicted RNA-binding protein YlqC (UPF0109 family)
MEHATPLLERILGTTTELLQLVADTPTPLKIEIVPTSDTELTVRVWVPSKSIGKLIGVSGRTARALRILLRAMSATAGVGIALDIVAEG